MALNLTPKTYFNPMTVLEVIQRSTEYLTKKGVDSPRLQVELMLAHVLKLKRMALYLNFERPLSTEETDLLREMVRRRGVREPLQHILGSTSFCGLEIAVSRDVLVPRPETELLAELGWQFLNSIVSANPNAQPVAMDYGTGSGCIAIALAANSPKTQILAVDVSPAALELAQKNATQLQMNTRITFCQGDGFSALPTGTRLDLLISNPPYIPSDEIATLDPEVKDFDPRLALDGGADGLDFYHHLARNAQSHLAPEGRVMIEFGDGQGDSIQKLFENEKWVVEAIKPDYSGRLRILIARRAA